MLCSNQSRPTSATSCASTHAINVHGIRDQTIQLIEKPEQKCLRVLTDAAVVPAGYLKVALALPNTTAEESGRRI
jgi:hypothetical protein